MSQSAGLSTRFGHRYTSFRFLHPPQTGIKQAAIRSCETARLMPTRAGRTVPAQSLGPWWNRCPRIRLNPWRPGAAVRACDREANAGRGRPETTSRCSGIRITSAWDHPDWRAWYEAAVHTLAPIAMLPSDIGGVDRQHVSEPMCRTGG
jgi:hypothetical protein